MLLNEELFSELQQQQQRKKKEGTFEKNKTRKRSSFKIKIFLIQYRKGTMTTYSRKYIFHCIHLAFDDKK